MPTGAHGRPGARQTGLMTDVLAYQVPPAPAFLFDLDGTLIDSVYQHVIAWRTALSRLNIDLSVWRIHRRSRRRRRRFLFAAPLLGIEPWHAFVVGDSVWDLLAARRAGALGIGVMSGGYGREELERSGAYRVYADPADLLARADEVGIRLG